MKKNVERVKNEIKKFVILLMKKSLKVFIKRAESCCKISPTNSNTVRDTSVQMKKRSKQRSLSNVSKLK